MASWDAESKIDGKEVFTQEEIDLFEHVSDGTGYIEWENGTNDLWEYLFRWVNNFYVIADDGQCYSFRVDDEEGIRTAYIMALKGSINYSDYRELVEELMETEGECIVFGDRIYYYKNGHFYRCHERVDAADLILDIINSEYAEVTHMSQDQIKKYL